TALQHAWATAVEMASTYTSQDLKSGDGDPGWRRFFVLMGSAIALLENSPIVPETPHYPKKLVKELRGLSKRLKLERRMRRWSQITSILDDETSFPENATLFLLSLRMRHHKWSVSVRPFAQ